MVRRLWILALFLVSAGAVQVPTPGKIVNKNETSPKSTGEGGGLHTRWGISKELWERLRDCCATGLVTPLEWGEDLLPESCTQELCDQPLVKSWFLAMKQWKKKAKTEDFEKEHATEMEKNERDNEPDMWKSLGVDMNELDAKHPASTARFRNVGNTKTPPIIRYKFAKDYSEETKRLFVQGMAAWEKRTCVVFVEDAEQASVTVRKGKKGQGNFFRSGNDAEVVVTNMMPDIVSHEMGHVLGLGHTTRRHDRDQFVTFHKELCTRGYLGEERRWAYKTCDVDDVRRESPGRRCLLAAVEPVDPKKQAAIISGLKKLKGGIHSKALKDFLDGVDLTNVDFKDHNFQRHCQMAFCAYNKAYQYAMATHGHMKTFGLYEYGSNMHYPYNKCLDKKEPSADLLRLMKRNQLKVNNPGRNGVTRNDLEIVRQLHKCKKLNVKWGYKGIQRTTQLYVHPKMSVGHMQKKIMKQIFGLGWKEFPSHLTVKGFTGETKDPVTDLLKPAVEGEVPVVELASPQWEDVEHKVKREVEIMEPPGLVAYKVHLKKLVCKKMIGKTEDKVLLNIVVDGVKMRLPTKEGETFAFKTDVTKTLSRSFSMKNKIEIRPRYQIAKAPLSLSMGQRTIMHGVGSPLRFIKKGVVMYEVHFVLEETRLLKPLPELTLKIYSLKEIEGTELGREEVFFRYRVDGRGTYRRHPSDDGHLKTKEGEHVSVKKAIKFKKRVDFNLWESDPVCDDLLGHEDFHAKSTQGRQKIRFDREGEWEMIYEITDGSEVKEAEGKKTLHLLELKEIKGTELGSEEVYFKWKVDDSKETKRHPERGIIRTKVRKPVNVDQHISFQKEIKLGLFEDDPVRDDWLGQEIFYAKDSNGPRTRKFEKDGIWELKYEIN